MGEREGEKEKGREKERERPRECVLWAVGGGQGRNRE